MFIDAAIAARIDRVEARLYSTLAKAVVDPGVHVLSIGCGAAVFIRPGSLNNKVIGVGLDGDLDEAALATIESAWAASGEPVRIELASLVGLEIPARLNGRGYRLVGFDHVMVRRLTAADAARTPAFEIDDDATAWLGTLIDGFAAPDGTGTAGDTCAREAIAAMMDDFAGAPGFRRYVARDGGSVVGAGTLRVDEGVAVMCGATTLPNARRRGVQAALLAARLCDAARAGCDLATVTTAPGTQSQANVARQGFTLGYVRAIVVRDP